MIGHITVMTDNLDKTVAFYKWLLSLPVVREFETDDGGAIAFMGEEETKFEIIYSPEYEKGPCGNVTIGFSVTDLAAKMELLDSRGIPHSPVISPVPNTRFCFFTDDNNVKIQLLERH